MEILSHRAFSSIEFLLLSVLLARLLAFAPLSRWFFLRWACLATGTLGVLIVLPISRSDQLVAGLAVACLLFLTLEERLEERKSRPLLLTVYGIIVWWGVQNFWSTGEWPLFLTVWSLLGALVGCSLVGGYFHELPKGAVAWIAWLLGLATTFLALYLSFVPGNGFLPLTLFCLSFPTLGYVMRINRPQTNDDPAH